MPVAGRMRLKTKSSGIFKTKRSKPVSVSRLTSMLVPKPKNAFQSPRVQIGRLCRCFHPGSLHSLRSHRLSQPAHWSHAKLMACSKVEELPTQPKMPP